jgi:hypothetical protein
MSVDRSPSSATDRCSAPTPRAIPTAAVRLTPSEAAASVIPLDAPYLWRIPRSRGDVGVEAAPLLMAGHGGLSRGQDGAPAARRGGTVLTPARGAAGSGNEEAAGTTGASAWSPRVRRVWPCGRLRGRPACRPAGFGPAGSRRGRARWDGRRPWPVGCQKSRRHAAYSYSWISPPRTSRSRPKFGPLLASARSDGTGVAWPSRGAGALVIMRNVASQDAHKLPAADDQQLVQALPADRPHPAFGVGVGRAPRRPRQMDQLRVLRQRAGTRDSSVGAAHTSRSRSTAAVLDGMQGISALGSVGIL